MPKSPVYVDADFHEEVVLRVPAGTTQALLVTLKDGDGGRDGSRKKGREVGMSKVPLSALRHGDELRVWVKVYQGGQEQETGSVQLGLKLYLASKKAFG